MPALNYSQAVSSKTKPGKGHTKRMGHTDLPANYIMNYAGHSLDEGSKQSPCSSFWQPDLSFLSIPDLKERPGAVAGTAWHILNKP